MNEEVAKGNYRHYKGNEYRVLEIGTHTETGERFVVYKALYGDGAIWLRPLSMFIETVEVDGKIVPRFERIDL